MAKIEYVNLETLPDVLIQELKEFQGDVEKIMADTCEEGIKEAKKKIVEDFGTLQKGKKDKNGKHYRSTFTTRKKNNLSRTLWNRQYQLSHLLEKGHYVYNQFGGAYDINHSRYNTTGDKTKAFGVWKDTEEYTAKFVEDTLNKKLK